MNRKMFEAEKPQRRSLCVLWEKILLRRMSCGWAFNPFSFSLLLAPWLFVSLHGARLTAGNSAQNTESTPILPNFAGNPLVGYHSPVSPPAYEYLTARQSRQSSTMKITRASISFDWFLVAINELSWHQHLLPGLLYPSRCRYRFSWLV